MNAPDIKFAALTNKLLQTMISADRSGATELVAEAMAGDISPESVITDILDPALLELGKLWGAESVSLAQTFVAAKIAEDILVQCQPRSNQNSPEKAGIAVLGNIEDDFHSLGRRIVASFLRANGWEVHDLGNDVPAELFVEKALETGASVIGVSAMMHTTAQNIRKLRKLIDLSGLTRTLKLAVGGAVFIWRPELVAEVGGDGTATNAALVSPLFHKLQAQAREHV